MRILMVVPEYPPYNIGGGGIVFKNLAESFKLLGHSVTIIYGFYQTSSYFDKIIKYEKLGINFIQVPLIPTPRNYTFLRTVLPPNLEFLKVKKLLKRFNPDLVFVHGYGLLFPAMCAKVLAKQKIPYNFVIHGFPLTSRKANPLIRIFYKFYEWSYGRITLKNSRKIITISKFISKNYRLVKYQNKIKVIYNGTNLSQKRVRKISLHNMYGLPKGSKIIFSVGRINEMKGFQNVIKYLEYLQSKFKESIYYIIAGPDEGYSNSLKNLAKKINMNKYVKFIGKINEKKRDQLIKSCDYYVVPSLSEPFGLVVLEGLVLHKVTYVNKFDGSLKELSKLFNLPDFRDIGISKKPEVKWYNLSNFSRNKMAEHYLECGVF